MNDIFFNLLSNNEPFLFSKFQNQKDITLFKGKIFTCKKIDEIKNLKSGKAVVLLPFSVAKEKYSFINDYGAEIIIMNVIKEDTIPISQALNCDLIKDFCSILQINSINGEDQYLKDVVDVIEKEIKNGEGANFMLCQKITGKIDNFNIQKALGLFLRLIKNEYGAYQIFCFFTGTDFFIGASPECHLNYTNGQVRMQPISGTFRKSDLPLSELKTNFVNFLQDKKEINELFMTVDEELKMMSKICPKGGKIIGPRLREMSKVIHTEYLLTGQSEANVYDIIKESLHAATLVGSPLENAFRIIQKYNNFDKEYYGSMLGIIDKNDNLDSSITIRTIRIDNHGKFTIFAGGSIVAESIPKNELAEIKAKLSSVLNNLTKDAIKMDKIMPYFEFDHDIAEILQARNQSLSNFWFFDKAHAHLINNKIASKTAIIIDNEDSFTQMLKHILEKIGLNTKIIGWESYNDNLDNANLTIIGPGPGNPCDVNNAKIKKLSMIVDKLLTNNKKIAGICLGHQIIAKHLGFEIKIGKEIFQGIQKRIDLWGIKEIVGFYNTFFALKNNNINIKQSYDSTGEIYALKGNNFFSFQFHPESLLTPNGLNILENNILEIIY